MYQIVELGTHRIVGTYSNRIRARRKADRLDLEYGCIRYFVRFVSAT